MKAQDLSQAPPRSPHFRIHDYVILARTLDKCRAHLNGTLGDYHFNCPLDRMLFDFKGIKAEDFEAKVKTGADDEEMGRWLDENGHVQTPGSISQWSAALDTLRPYDNPDKRQWFAGRCAELGLDPRSTTLFGFLEADDKTSFPGSVQVSPDQHNWDLPIVETAPRPRDSSIKAALH